VNSEQEITTDGPQDSLQQMVCLPTLCQTTGKKKNEIFVLTWHIEFTTIEDVICLQKIEKK
jgi:hypothetical protein